MGACEFGLGLDWISTAWHGITTRDRQQFGSLSRARSPADSSQPGRRCELAGDLGRLLAWGIGAQRRSAVEFETWGAYLAR
jgi:hypothetical protein